MASGISKSAAIETVRRGSRRIKIAADWLTAKKDKPIVVPELAASAGMSLTSFHRHFKAVTGYSPLAFQRQVRLLEAWRMLVAAGASVSRVACLVGYVCPTQFSREYRGLFGAPPATDLPGVEGTAARPANRMRATTS